VVTFPQTRQVVFPTHLLNTCNAAEWVPLAIIYLLTLNLCESTGYIPGIQACISISSVSADVFEAGNSNCTWLFRMTIGDQLTSHVVNGVVLNQHWDNAVNDQSIETHCKELLIVECCHKARKVERINGDFLLYWLRCSSRYTCTLTCHAGRLQRVQTEIHRVTLPPYVQHFVQHWMILQIDHTQSHTAYLYTRVCHDMTTVTNRQVAKLNGSLGDARIHKKSCQGVQSTMYRRPLTECCAVWCAHGSKLLHARTVQNDHPRSSSMLCTRQSTTTHTNTHKWLVHCMAM